jgi:two-component system response regulator YesN
MGRILAIDDEPSVFHAIEVTLDPPHRVERAREIPEARWLIRVHPPDLILLDYLLFHVPSIPGFLAELRQTLPMTPILVLTAQDDLGVAVEAFRGGADDFILKPFDVLDVQHRVGAFFSTRPRPPERLPRDPARIPPPSLPVGPSPLLRAIRAWIAFPSRPTVERVARDAGCSTRHLLRLFKRYFGMRPREFFEGLTMRRAASLVQHSHAPISDIAALLQFYDQSHFDRIFRKHAGMTPSQYRSLRQGSQ